MPLIASGAADEWQWSGKRMGYSFFSSGFIAWRRSVAQSVDQMKIWQLLWTWPAAFRHLAWSSVFVYFGCRPVLLCVDSICCHYCSASTWHLKWPAPNGTLSRPMGFCFVFFLLLFLRERTACELLDQINMHKRCAVLLTHIHACKTTVSSVCRNTLRVRYKKKVSLFQTGKTQ